MVKRIFSKTGLVFSAIFFSYAAYNLYLASTGAWQAPILNAIITFPFSIAANDFCDWLQVHAQLSHESRSRVESALVMMTGVIEFYLLGFFCEKLLASK